MGKLKLGIVFFALILGTSTLAQQAIGGQVQQKALTNADVVAMVQAGLDEAVIIAKIEHSPVAFDCTTEGLVSLKKDNVPTSVVKIMINRPAGLPAATVREERTTPQPAAAKASSLKDVSRVAIRADSEVLRVTIEQRLRAIGGPSVSVGNAEADATLSFATDCGAQTISMWSGANFCTCEASLSLESDGARIWSNMDRERSANAAKASKKLAENMVGKFVADWKRAKAK